MKFRQPLDDLLGQLSKVRILRRLIITGLELNGRQIAADIGMSPAACHRALKELAEQGVLVVRNIGHTHLYRLNEEAYLVTHLLRPLFQGEQAALDAAVREIVSGLDGQVTTLVLYGSVARGEERPFSDIDLLAIVPSHPPSESVADRLAEQSVSFAARFGNMLAPLVLSEEEFRTRYHADDALLIEIVRAGQTLYGPAPSAILAAEGSP